MRNHNIIIGLAFAAEVLLFNSAHAQSGVPDNDYPTESLKAGEQGTVEFKVDVTIDGKPENCVIVKSSGYPRLDKAMCDLFLRRAHFKPATDDKGAPLRGSYPLRPSPRALTRGPAFSFVCGIPSRKIPPMIDTYPSLWPREKRGPGSRPGRRNLLGWCVWGQARGDAEG